MTRRRTAAAALLAALGLLVPAAATASSSGPAHAPILGVVPHVGHATRAAAASSPQDLVLQESPCTLSSSPFACWTMPTNTAYAIYWVPSGFKVDANYETLIDRYFRDVAAASGSATNVYSVATQYYDSTSSVAYESTFGGSYVDTTPFPASGCSDGVDSVCLTDDQIQTEIQNVLTATGWHGSTAATFFVMTPQGVGSCYDNVTGQCTTTTYCAYHAGFYDANHEPVVYANEPYAATMVDANGHKVCTDGTSPNGDDADATISTISHEQSEMITDPAGDAWLSGSGQEIGDLCVWQFGTPLGGTVGADAYNQVINGHRYWIQEEYSNDGSACVQRYTPAVAPSRFAVPALTGTAAEGQLLSTTDGAWKHAPSGYAYQWQRCAAGRIGCVDIAGAKAATYRVTATDIGHAIRAEVEAQNAAGSSPFAASAPTLPVVPVPLLTAQPVLSGPAVVGKELHTTTGLWNSTVTVAYEWLRCGTDGSACSSISGANTALYRLAPADAGHTIEARVSGTNAAGTTTAVANQTGVVEPVPLATSGPRVDGRARVGSRLSARRGTWTDAPASFAYQWLRCDGKGGACVRIAGATRSTYRLRSRDAGHRLRVRVTAAGAAGSGTATSPASPRVSAHSG